MSELTPELRAFVEDEKAVADFVEYWTNVFHWDVMPVVPMMKAMALLADRDAKLQAVQRKNETLDIDVGVLTEQLAKVRALRDELSQEAAGERRFGLMLYLSPQRLANKLDAILTKATTGGERG